MIKKLFVVVFVTIFSIAIFPQISKSNTSVGGGLDYLTASDDLGFDLRAYFSINENFRVQPDFQFFFTNESATFLALDANINYIIDKVDNITFYALAGPNLSFILPEYGENDTKFGFNLGLGQEFEVGKDAQIYVELKYGIASQKQVMIMSGVKFAVN